MVSGGRAIRSSDVGLVKIARPLDGLTDSRYSAIPALSVDASQRGEEHYGTGNESGDYQTNRHGVHPHQRG